MFDIHATTAAAYSVEVAGDSFLFSAVNEACLALVGITARFYPGLDPRTCFAAPVADEILKRYRLCRDTRQAVSYVAEASTGVRTWQTTLFPTVDDAGRVVTIVGICTPVAHADCSNHRAENRDDRLMLAMSQFDGGFWVYEIATGVFETSTSLAEYIAGPGHASLNLAEYASFVYAKDLDFRGLLMPESDKSTAEYRVMTYDGRTRWLQCRRCAVRDNTGVVVRVVGLVIDVTEQKSALRVLENEASTDPLTALRNRRAFDRVSAEAFAQACATGEAIGILLIDLDGFKPINDRFGHCMGDKILRLVASRLNEAVPPSCTLARIGGDEFAVLLPTASLASGEALARNLAAAFNQSIEIGDQSVYVDLSTGLAILTRTDSSIDALLERADRNLYAAKKQKRLLTA